MSKAAELANLIGNINAGGGGANKNLLINGNCAVAQRGDQSSKSSDHYTAVDRFEIQISSSGAVTSTQSTTVPTGEGFNNSLKVDVVTNNGGSEDSGDYLILMQKIEGLNLQQLKFGTSSAVPLALSFYVRSNLTGTFQFVADAPDSGSYRYFSKTYTIDSANTWEKKTINIPANTNSTAIPDDNTEGLRVQWQLVGGSSYTSGSYSDGTWQGTGANTMSSSANNTFARSTDNEFLITGVQLEVGQNPTEFEHEPFDTTLRKCKRYYESKYFRYGTYAAIGFAFNSNSGRVRTDWEVVKRADPSVTFSGSASVYKNGNSNSAASFSAEVPSQTGTRINVTTTATDMSSGSSFGVHADAAWYVQGDSEL
jgi:hypothetical protein